ncbi:hypothetical protein NPX13_g6198 [Xylaria arbuscula]|uniref:Uncharacterized protein n=1 Tax=Xylaria arbuscula TaxID=114810 RepID=A0A9W8TKC3_9PEZI|nr:hypothetical protein NPX13_g6198 [Xylaria arbuscula]
MSPRDFTEEEKACLDEGEDGAVVVVISASESQIRVATRDKNNERTLDKQVECIIDDETGNIESENKKMIMAHWKCVANKLISVPASGDDNMRKGFAQGNMYIERHCLAVSSSLSLSLLSLDILVNRVLAAAAGFVPASQHVIQDGVESIVSGRSFVDGSDFNVKNVEPKKSDKGEPLVTHLEPLPKRNESRIWTNNGGSLPHERPTESLRIGIAHSRDLIYRSRKT